MFYSQGAWYKIVKGRHIAITHDMMKSNQLTLINIPHRYLEGDIEPKTGQFTGFIYNKINLELTDIKLGTMFKHICPRDARQIGKTFICAEIKGDYGYGAAMVECHEHQNTKCYRYSSTPYHFVQHDFKC